MTLFPKRFGCRGLRVPLLGRWQIELWFCPARSVIPFHTHPGIDSTLVFLAGRMWWWMGGKGRVFGLRDFGAAFKVPAGIEHGAQTTGRFGLFLNLERWLPGAKTSAATNLELCG